MFIFRNTNLVENGGETGLKRKKKEEKEGKKRKKKGKRRKKTGKKGKKEDNLLDFVDYYF